MGLCWNKTTDAFIRIRMRGLPESDSSGSRNSRIPRPMCVPHCGKSPVRKLFSSPAIQFKGSGFYITDYAKKSSSEAGSKSSSGGESSASGSSESKSSESKSSDSKSSDAKSSSTESKPSAKKE